MIEVLGIKNAQKLVPMAEDQKPADPVTENQNILMMKPVKAFSYQDHEAHIQVHMAAMQDPKIQALLQNNPQAQQIGSAMMAHVNEHLGYAYRAQIAQQMGMPMPPQQLDDMGEEEDIEFTPEMEARLAPMMAQAAQKLLMQNQQAQQAQQNAQQQQDPIIQIQMQELQIKQQEQQRKATKDQTDAQIKMQQLQLESERIKSQQRVAGMQTVTTAAIAQDKLKNQQRTDAGKMVLDALGKERQNQHVLGQKAMSHLSQKELNQQQAELQPKVQTPKKETK
jgi:hypothetical protein